MLDTLKVRVPLDHAEAINGGHLKRSDHRDEPMWSQATRFQLAGSFDDRLSVISRPTILPSFLGGPTLPGSLQIEGSFAKFMQGHNVWGSEDLRGMVAMIARLVVRTLVSEGFDVAPSRENLADWDAGEFDVHRADCTYSMPMASRSEALQWIHACEQMATVVHRGRGLLKGNTLYFGKESRRWSLKLYSKGQEVNARGKGHALPAIIQLGDHGPAMREHVEPLLRAELVLRKMQLDKTGFSRGSAWTADTCRTLHAQYFEQMTMPDHIELPDHLEAQLPQRLRSTYALHCAGRDTRALLPDRTWYRHRKELREHGIDLAANIGNDPDRSNVVPFVRRITATMDYDRQVPDWARGTALYFDPASETRTG